jgi:hypothetical protein
VSNTKALEASAEQGDDDSAAEAGGSSAQCLDVTGLDVTVEPTAMQNFAGCTFARKGTVILSQPLSVTFSMFM